MWLCSWRSFHLLYVTVNWSHSFCKISYCWKFHLLSQSRCPSFVLPTVFKQRTPAKTFYKYTNRNLLLWGTRLGSALLTFCYFGGAAVTQWGSTSFWFHHNILKGKKKGIIYEVDTKIWPSTNGPNHKIMFMFHQGTRD